MCEKSQTVAFKYAESNIFRKKNTRRMPPLVNTEKIVNNDNTYSYFVT